MNIGAADDQMTSMDTAHVAVWKPDSAERDSGAWFVSWLPSHRLTRGQAMVAMLVAEHVTEYRAKPGEVTGMSLPLSKTLRHGWLRDLPVAPDLERIVVMLDTADTSTPKNTAQRRGLRATRRSSP